MWSFPQIRSHSRSTYSNKKVTKGSVGKYSTTHCLNHFHNQSQKVWFLKYFLRQASDLIIHMWLDLWKPFQIAHWKQSYSLVLCTRMFSIIFLPALHMSLFGFFKQRSTGAISKLGIPKIFYQLANSTIMNCIQALIFYSRAFCILYICQFICWR